MKKLLGLMHDTSGKTNRIKLRVQEFTDEIKRTNPEFLNKKLTNNENLTIAFYLRDIKNQAENLDKVLDNFYLENKDE
jgi:ABC-type multidrug transport system ATPase subunit